MFLTILCYYYSCVDGPNSEDILKEFTECNNTCVPQGYNRITEYDINQTICIRGSFIIGANESFTVTAGFSTNSTTEPFKAVKPQKNILSVLQHTETPSGSDASESKNFQAITKIICDKYPCKIQLLGVEPSYFGNYKTKEGNISVKYDLVYKSYVSTKRSSSVTLPYILEFKWLKYKENVEAYQRRLGIQIAGFNNKSFTYNVGKNITLLGNVDQQYLRTTNESDVLGPASVLKLFVLPNFDGNATKGATKGDFELSWKESKETSSDDEKKMLIPEFEATLSAKGGVFTEENIDQPLPGDGLSAGAIAGIVIACIAVVAIIAVCIWLFALGGIKKCKKDKSDSSSKKEQEDK